MKRIFSAILALAVCSILAISGCSGDCKCIPCDNPDCQCIDCKCEAGECA